LVSLSIAVVLSATLVGAAGCASARNGLGTSSAVCFQAIPVGRSALGKPAPVVVSPPTSTTSTSGTTATSGAKTTTTSAGTTTTRPGPVEYKPGPNPVFVGVRSASLKDVDQFGETHAYVESVLEKANGGPIKGLCLVAFKGSFDPAAVHDLVGRAPPQGQRTFAIVVVSAPSNRLLGTFIRSREPISFTHYSVGG
jgi:hypothetical protein